MKRPHTLCLPLLTGLLLCACGPGQTRPVVSPPVAGSPATDTERPRIELTVSPQTLTVVGPVTVRANASDDRGVTAVSFYDGPRLLETDREAPYEVTATYAAADNGTRSLRAVAVDAAGNQAEATVTLTVAVPGAAVPDTQKPVVSLSATPQSLTAPGAVELTAAATDNVAVTGVTFYRGETRLGEDTAAPYTFRDELTAAMGGAVTYRAVASDAAGNTAEATAPVTVGVAGQPTPAPPGTPGAQVSIVENSRTSYTVQVTPEQSARVRRAEVYDNGRLVVTDTQAPYTADLTYTAADNGAHVILVKIYDDQGGVTEVRRELTVNVPVSSDAPPSVTLAPDRLDVVREEPLTLTAAAQDDRGISRVEFFLDGVPVGRDAEAPYTVTLSFTATQSGTRVLTARAYDTAGQTAEASTVLAVNIDAGDFVDRATPIAIGESVDGVIAGSPRDRDVYRFTGAAEDRLRLTVRGQSGPFPGSTLDPYVTVLMPDGKTVLEQDDDSGEGYDAELLFNLPVEGTYYIVVTSFRIFDDPRATDDRPTNLYRLSLSRR